MFEDPQNAFIRLPTPEELRARPAGPEALFLQLRLPLRHGPPARRARAHRPRHAGGLPRDHVRAGSAQPRRAGDAGGGRLRGAGLPILNAVSRRVSACRAQRPRAGRRHQAAALAGSAGPDAAPARPLHPRREDDPGAHPHDGRRLAAPARPRPRRSGAAGSRARDRHLQLLPTHGGRLRAGAGPAGARGRGDWRAAEAGGFVSVREV